MSKRKSKKNDLAKAKVTRRMASERPKKSYDASLLWVLGAIVLLSFIAFSPSLSNDFVNWDDDIYVTDNPLITQLSAENVYKYFTEPIASNYHPITILSLAIDYQIAELKPFWYHLVNVLLHYLNILLVFYFTYLLSHKNKMVGLITCLIFALHPMHVESVAWVAERKDVLYTVFFMLSLIVYLFYQSTKNIRYLLACFAFFVLSLLSKPSAVVLPLILLLIDWYQNRKLNDKWLLLEKIPFFVLAFVIGYVTVLIQADTAISDFDKYSLAERFCFASYGFVMYLVKLFVPFKLSALHPYPLAAGSLPTIFWLMPALVVLLLGLTVWSLKRTKVLAFGMAFYFINLALVLQFVSVGMAVMSERYTYVSYIGLAFIIGLAFDYGTKQQGAFKKYGQYGLVACALVLAVLTYQRCQVWQNGEKLWTDVIEKYPNKAPVAYNNRGNYFRNKGKIPAAIKDFNQAIAIKSDYHLAYTNRGNAYFSSQKNELALADYNKVLSLVADNDKAYCNRAAVYFKMGKYPEGIADATKAIELNPYYVDAYMNRGVLYSVTKQHQLAAADYTSLLKYQPKNHQVLNWRGIAYRNLKQYQKSLSDFNKAIALQAKGEYYLNRSYTYNEMQNKTQALQDAQKAQQLGSKINKNYLNTLK